MSELEQSIDLDYYKILAVGRKASVVEICAAYRNLALRYHPSLQHQNKNEAYHKFCQASEAFDVLFDVEKKKIYDQYGQQKLKDGVLKDASLIGKYKFTNEPEEIFEKFFGSRNVFEHLLEVGRGKGVSHPIFKAQYPESKEDYKVQNLKVPVKCTLTQLYNGCVKELTYDKKVLTKDGKNSEVIQQTKKITINPGESAKQPLVFPEQGHAEPGYTPSLLVFDIVEIEEKNYRREKNNLIYTAKISLMDALDSKSITVTELNGGVIHLHFDEVISPQTRRVIKGKGMPVKGKVHSFGDLIVQFDIQFPQELDYEKKEKIVALLSDG